MEKLVQNLQKSTIALDGEAAHRRIFPDFQARNINTQGFRKSAVMACFVLHQEESCLILIRRTNFGKHANQIAFPGGKQEPEDDSLWDTAVRECKEEVGLEGKIKIKKLSPVFIPVSQFEVHPFIAYDPSPQTLLIGDPDEVAEILYLPVSELIKLPITKNTVESFSGPMEALGFPWRENFIWGATAMMLSEIQIILQNAAE